LEKYKLIKREH